MENGRPGRPGVRPGGAAPLLLQTVHEHRPEVGTVRVLKARGTVDVSNALEFSEALAEHIAHAGRDGEHPVLDMTEVYLACAAAVRSLDRATGVLAFSGRALPVVQPRPHVREALMTAGLPGVRVHASLASALHALEARTAARPADPAAPGDDDPAEAAVDRRAPTVHGGARSGRGRSSSV
ncbi:STAS domain-containing protein [Streptomyces sp. NPDC052301]|uniref:STAS domain-containing protein n=1 Tax=Streptomyces sp. NPDC052301 TaxID=3365687 RepID=UPI0037D46578